ncbi:MAG: hypothetical protein JWM33_679, partial [Caulobacteraceae bacterium]|nr:hypothetical protein [Caulobacteraceae bacterium]
LQGILPVREEEDDRKPALPSAAVPISPRPDEAIA